MPYSIWLEFDDASTSNLRDEIIALSAELGGPRFAPHMTLIGDIDLPIYSVLSLAERFAKCSLPQKLVVEQVSTTQKYFMALYLSVRMPERLMKMRNALIQEVHPGDYSLDEPHVSLAYGDYSYRANSHIISRLEQKFEGKSLDARYINVVQSSKCTPISEWKIINRVEFV